MVPIVIKTSQKATDTIRRAGSQFEPVITALQLTFFLQIVICMDARSEFVLVDDYAHRY